jgi:hypothetical protein
MEQYLKARKATEMLEQQFPMLREAAEKQAAPAPVAKPTRKK